jgi:hypothetical protein
MAEIPDQPAEVCNVPVHIIYHQHYVLYRVGRIFLITNFTLLTVTYVQQLLDKLKELQYGSLALVVGRYYAMDRDKRFERNKIAFEGLVQGIGEVATPETVVEVCLVLVAVVKLPHKFCMYSHYLVS